MIRKGTTDLPATEDLFKITNYISGLCSFITDCNTPMTIAIQGDWGSGKTSVMEMVQNKMDEDKKPVHCVWFNTWQFSQFNTSDCLAISMIETIIDKISDGCEEQDESTKNKFGWLKSATSNLAKNALYIASDRILGSTMSGKFREKLEPTEGAEDHDEIPISDTIAELKEQFQEYVKIVIGKKGVDRILVFIDDLDRLEPLRAVELLEVLKNFLDCENCVFILAIDYNVVVSGVKSKYGADFDENKGRSFFDKIIQVPFKMPVAQYDISNFVKKTLAEVSGIKCDDAEAEIYVSLINSSIGSNPRSMKRLFNSFLLLLKVVGNELPDNDNMSKKILFATLCMQLRFESLYNHIVINRDSIDAEFFGKLVSDDEVKQLLEKEGIDFSEDEVGAIQDFIECFSAAVTQGLAEDGMTEEDWQRVKELLSCSTVVATEKAAPAAKKRPTFTYCGDTYMTQGANKMNLSSLALRLIQDYVKETDIDANQFVEKINSQIACYSTYLKKAGLGQINERSNLNYKRNIWDYHFSDKKEVVRIGDKELYVAKAWGTYELVQLIDILGYRDKVQSNQY